MLDKYWYQNYYWKRIFISLKAFEKWKLAYTNTDHEISAEKSEYNGKSKFIKWNNNRLVGFHEKFYPK